MSQFSVDATDTDQVLKVHGNLKRSILIGNGFNIALPDYGHLFHWHRLKDKIADVLSPFEKELLQEHDWHFERALHDLKISIKLMNSLVGKTEQDIEPQIAFLKHAEDSIRKHFFTAVLKSHPQKNQYIRSKDAKRFCILFERFSAVFSLNYDLMLYWGLEAVRWRNHNDGFYGGGADEIPWNSKNTAQNVYYLHGNLNFREWRSEDLLMKQGRVLFGDIASLISCNRCVVVAESTSENKFDHISRRDCTGYLAHSLHQLSIQAGLLLVHGVSFENDDHILTNILKNPQRWTAIYIGVHQIETRGAKHVLTGKIEDLCNTLGIPLSDLPPVRFYESSLFESIL